MQDEKSNNIFNKCVPKTFADIKELAEIKDFKFSILSSKASEINWFVGVPCHIDITIRTYICLKYVNVGEPGFLDKSISVSVSECYQIGSPIIKSEILILNNYLIKENLMGFNSDQYGITFIISGIIYDISIGSSKKSGKRSLCLRSTVPMNSGHIFKNLSMVTINIQEKEVTEILRKCLIAIFNKDYDLMKLF